MTCHLFLYKKKIYSQTIFGDYVKSIKIFFLVILSFALFFVIRKTKNNYNDDLIQYDIISHYNQYVQVTKLANIYHIVGEEYIPIGEIYPGNIIELSTMEDDDMMFFNLKGTDYYIDYDSVIKSDYKDYSKRFKNYIPFNKSVVTEDDFTLYEDDMLVIHFIESQTFPILINDYNGKYFIEYNNHLLNIKKEDVKEIVDNINTNKKNTNHITTLAYHRVYDEKTKCNDPYVCIKKSSFDKEMKYLKDNNYFSLTMEEMYLYLLGKLQIEKGIVITLDDGYLYQDANDILNKYDLNGTIFVISSYFKDITPYKNLSNLYLQSHTHNMHRNYVCPGGNQGGAILCASEKEIKNDLELSLEKLEVEPWAIAYPFYDYNDKAIKVLKETDFKMAFIGRYNTMGKAYPNKTNLYKIPRMTVWEESIMNFNEWKSFL